MIYNLYFYNRFCECIFYAEWNIPSHLANSIKAEARDRHLLPGVKNDADRRSIYTTNSAHSKRSLDHQTLSSTHLPHKAGYPGSINPLQSRTLLRENRYSSATKMSILKYEDKRFSALPSTATSNRQNFPSVPDKSIDSASISASVPQKLTDQAYTDVYSIVDAWQLDKTNPNDPLLEEGKLVYGAVFSIRNIVNKLRGADGAYGKNLGEFYSYRTKNYKCHYFESPSGLKIVLNSDANAGSLQPQLEHIYSQIYVEFITKNPMTNVKQRDQTFEGSDTFKAALNSYIQSLPVFTS